MSRRPMVVIGSANTDMLMQTPSIPLPGETALGKDFYTVSGGKGANQAVALARLGRRPVSFLACLGDDNFGKRAIDNYKADNIDTSRIVVEKNKHSGIAFIFVAENSENSIGVSARANACLSPSHIDQNEDLISTAAMVLIQLEIPIETITHAIDMCNRHKVPIILNPAPVNKTFNKALLAKVDILTPNEIEAGHLTDINVVDLKSAEKAGKKLLSYGVNQVIITLGAAGAMLCNINHSKLIKAPQVHAIDTTGAGDTFNGALAIALTEGLAVEDAIAFASHAAALSVTTLGTQPSIPTREDVDAFIGNIAVSN